MPKLVVLGDLRELEEEEAAARIKYGINLLRKSFAIREEESEVAVIVSNSGHPSLLAKLAEESNWTMKSRLHLHIWRAQKNMKETTVTV